MAGTKQRVAELQAKYKRIKQVINNDPDISFKVLTIRFNVGYTKLRKLKDEVNAEQTK